MGSVYSLLKTNDEDDALAPIADPDPSSHKECNTGEQDDVAHLHLAMRDVYTRLTALELQTRIIVMHSMIDHMNDDIVALRCHMEEAKRWDADPSLARPADLDGWMAIIARPFVHRYHRHVNDVFRVAYIVSRTSTNELIQLWCDMQKFPKATKKFIPEYKYNTL